MAKSLFSLLQSALVKSLQSQGEPRCRPPSPADALCAFHRAFRGFGACCTGSEGEGAKECEGQRGDGSWEVSSWGSIWSLEHEFYFSIQLGIIIPTDELIFFRGVQTSNQMGISWEYFNGFIYSWEVPQQEGTPSTAIFLYPLGIIEHGWRGNPRSKWRFLAGKSIYEWRTFHCHVWLLEGIECKLVYATPSKYKTTNLIPVG